MWKAISRKRLVKSILIFQLVLCILFLVLFFFNNHWAVINLAFAKAFHNELVQMKDNGIEQISVNDKIASYTPLEFADQSSFMAKKMEVTSTNGMLFSILVITLTLLALLLIGSNNNDTKTKP